MRGLPFDPGECVEVLVISKTAGSNSATHGDLRGSVLQYSDPLEPVASDDWDALL